VAARAGVPEEACEEVTIAAGLDPRTLIEVRMAAAMTDISPGGNLFARLPSSGTDEDIATLLTMPNVRIERIVSTGQASPPGFWWDQEWAEWVVLLTGSAGLRVEGEAEVRELKPGDYLHIPAHARHRVEWTHPGEPTVWLAVHIR
jgi:cupin 2 domain-containing protein